MIDKNNQDLLITLTPEKIYPKLGFFHTILR